VEGQRHDGCEQSFLVLVERADLDATGVGRLPRVHPRQRSVAIVQ
jgi:hypothetical protein